ncbi:MAG: hypothetical protein IJZ10_05515 [Thermoguttaceae bacterium]|nr:hypothetical protein [Thermoguttaceae bacterium]
MDDFETLSFEVLGRKVEPVEPKRDVEAPVEPETVRRVRVGLDALTAELAEAKEAVAYLEARENELLAEKAELARSLDEARAEYKELDAEFDKTDRELAVAERDVERWRVALDVALNDVAFWKRAAFWFAVSSLLAAGVAVAAFRK